MNAFDNVTIRPAVYEDLVCIQDIEHAASPAPWSRNAIVNELSNDKGLNLLAQWSVGDRPCGFVLSAIVDDEMSIHHLATHPAFQRRGIARRLVETALALAHEREVKNAYLEVRSKNSVAFDLYIKLGFCVQSIRKKYYSDDGDDAFIMQRRV